MTDSTRPTTFITCAGGKTGRRIATRLEARGYPVIRGSRSAATRVVSVALGLPASESREQLLVNDRFGEQIQSTLVDCLHSHVWAAIAGHEYEWGVGSVL